MTCKAYFPAYRKHRVVMSYIVMLRIPSKVQKVHKPTIARHNDSIIMYNPSIYRTNAAQTAPPDPSAVQPMLEAVEDCNSRLQKQPYDPELWTERAGYFLALNYPELAVSDAYKAELLFDRATNEDGKEAGSANEARMRAYGIMGQALYDSHCHMEAAEFWEDVSKKVASPFAKTKAEELRALLERKKEAAAQAGLGGTEQEQKDRLRDGGVITVHYPWMEKRHLTRTPETVDQINEELKNMEPQFCYLKQSSLADRTDMLGMFAARDIEAGECILLDRTATGICSNSGGFICGNCYGHVKCPPIQSQCCSLSAEAAHASMNSTQPMGVYCSTACYDLAMSTYHKLLCGQDFNWLLSPAKGLEATASPMRPLLMLRFLASCIQNDPNASPLDYPLIARLQPLANRNHLDVFTLTESVVTPIKILQQLGIDVFANQHFDTMVLHTIWTRIANNKAGSADPKRGFIDEITPFLPLFNHSCDPNVEYKREDSSTTIRFFAKRAIKKDEEMFDSYLKVEGMDLEERVNGLWPWFEEPCLCPKCKREMAVGLA